MGTSDPVSTSVTLLKRLQVAPQDKVAWSDFAGRSMPVVNQWCRGMANESGVAVTERLLPAPIGLDP